MKKSARKSNEFNAKAFERPGLTEEEVMEIRKLLICSILMEEDPLIQKVNLDLK